MSIIASLFALKILGLWFVPIGLTVKTSLGSLLKSQPEGHTFNYSCGNFDVEEKGFSPCSQYNKCNTENILENGKIQGYF